MSAAGKNAFIAERRARWERLQALLAKRGRTYAETRELGERYRDTIEDLSYAQTAWASSDVETWLNGLVRACHLELYRPRRSRLAALVAFFTRTVPANLLRLGIPTLVSLAVFAASFAVSFAMVARDTELAEAFLDSQTYAMAQRDLEQGKQFGNFDDIPSEVRPGLTAFLWFNNIKVALVCFAFGITLGLGTLWVLSTNGFMLGALSAFYVMNGWGADFFSIIMLHGSLELPAIVLSGGIGFSIFAAAFMPGRLSRLESLKAGGTTAIVALVAVVGLLVIAGLLEGLVTASKPGMAVRVAIGIANLALLALLYARGAMVKAKTHADK